MTKHSLQQRCVSSFMWGSVDTGKKTHIVALESDLCT